VPYADTLPNARVAAVPEPPRVTPAALLVNTKVRLGLTVAETVNAPVPCAIAAIGSNIARAKITSVAFFILFTLLKVLHQS
jgi:hypothetical protein